MINTLLDLDWDPTGPWDWTSDMGDQFLATEQILESKVFDITDLKAELARTVRRRIWRKAAKHYESEDVGEGLYLEDIRSQLKRARAAEQYAWEGSLLTVSTGGQWPRTRIEQVCQLP